MTDTMIRIFVIAIQRKMERGDTLEDILESYPKLSTEDKDILSDIIVNKSSN